MRKNFDKENVFHSHVVCELCRILKEEEFTVMTEDIEAEFNSLRYKYFKKIDWSRARDKEEYDFSNSDDYRELKTRDLLSVFTFEKREIFFQALEDSIKIKEDNYNVRSSI